MSNRIQRGRIVWVRLGPRGDWKLRPAVVLHDVPDPKPDSLIRLVGGTTAFTKPLSENEIPLPFHPPPNPHPLTKLKTETIVACDWIVEVENSQIELLGGFVPGSALFRIFERIAILFGTRDPQSIPVTPIDEQDL